MGIAFSAVVYCVHFVHWAKVNVELGAFYLSCGFSFSGAQTRRRLPLTSSGSGVVAADVVVICVVCAGKSENLEIDTPGRK